MFIEAPSVAVVREPRDLPTRFDASVPEVPQHVLPSGARFRSPHVESRAIRPCATRLGASASTCSALRRGRRDASLSRHASVRPPRKSLLRRAVHAERADFTACVWLGSLCPGSPSTCSQRQSVRVQSCTNNLEAQTNDTNTEHARTCKKVLDFLKFQETTTKMPISTLLSFARKIAIPFKPVSERSCTPNKRDHQSQTLRAPDPEVPQHVELGRSISLRVPRDSFLPRNASLAASGPEVPQHV